MPNVRCTVEDCVYWDRGNKCGADEIWITLDRLVRGKEDMEAGSLETVQTPARSRMDTCCSTYTPRKDARPRGEE